MFACRCIRRFLRRYPDSWDIREVGVPVGFSDVIPTCPVVGAPVSFSDVVPMAGTFVTCPVEAIAAGLAAIPEELRLGPAGW